jgi:uncharacterized membrane protein YidH (DUF202 family)
VNLGVFLLGGIILIAAGILQLLVRSRPAERRGFDGTMVRTAVFVLFGLLAVLVGLGVLPLVRL